MSEDATKKKEADLLKEIGEIEDNTVVSPKLAEVSALKKSFDSYVDKHKGKDAYGKNKKKPNDYGAVSNAATALSKAVEAFDINESATYAKNSAIKLAAKVDDWILKNLNDQAGIRKVTEFRAKVTKHSKKAGSTGSNDSSGTGAGKVVNLDVLHKSLQELKANGIKWPAGKAALMEAWGKTEDIAKKVGQAASGLYTNLVAGAKDESCNKIKYAVDDEGKVSKTKFEPQPDK